MASELLERDADLSADDEVTSAAGVARPHRVLVLSADMGGGHNATATALEEAVERCWPGSEIRRLDTLDVMGPGIGAAFRQTYVTNVETTPWLYEFFYASLWRHRWFARASKRFTGSWCGRRLARHIDSFDPDLVLSTYPLGSSGLAWLRTHRGLAPTTAAWISDFAPHPFWIYRELDANYVMHPVARAHAWAADPGAVIRVSAPPVPSRFAARDHGAARRELGLPGDRLVVLLSCGSYAFGDTEAMVRTMCEASGPVTVLAVCGHDEAAKQSLESLGVDPERLYTFGWVDDMSALLNAADLVVTNAGGATALEAMVVGTPVVSAVPIAAHGAANTDLMAVSGAGELCVDLDGLRQLVSAHARDYAAGRFGTDRMSLPPAPDGSLDEALLALVRRRDESPGDGPETGPSGPDSAPRRHAPRRSRRVWPMRASDAFFWHVEESGLPQEVGAIAEVDPLPSGRALDAAGLAESLRPRLSGLPTSRRVLVRRPLGWLLHDRVDLDRHIDEKAPADDTERAQWDAAAELWHRSLPEGQPGWAMRLVRPRRVGNVADAGEEGDTPSLFCVKLHHCHADGISAIGLFDRLLDPAEGDPLIERRPGKNSTSGKVSPWLLARGLVSLATRGTAPRHPLNSVGQTGRTRMAAVALDWAQVRSAAALHDMRPHELILGVLADSLIRVLGEAGLLSDGQPIRVMVPVAMRAPRLDRISGNWTGSVAVDVPTRAMTTTARVGAVRDELRSRAARGEGQAAALAMKIAGELPGQLHGWFARSVYGRRFTNTVVSYMPGARGPRWLAGARVRFLVPVLPLAPGLPVTVGVIVSDGVAGVGIWFDEALELDPDRMCATVQNSFEQVAAT
ncbi:MAG TPA: WS/DGAT domain-containing protein [Nocardioidaceae bacterium]|nr:WS/DGAT domain-containing protein [Nocardioidaceae bacterium]